MSRLRRYAATLAVVPALLRVLVVAQVPGAHAGAQLPPPQPYKSIVLEVINRHNTVGLKIPSLYLRVYTNREAECQSVIFSSEPGEIRRKKLGSAEMRRLGTILADRALSRVDHDYGLKYWVIDSWMEWDIQVSRLGQDKTFTILNFAPDAAERSKAPYPEPIVAMGCEIWKIRNEVFGDAEYQGLPFYREAACARAGVN